MENDINDTNEEESCPVCESEKTIVRRQALDLDALKYEETMECLECGYLETT